ncbi:NAD(P)-dependent oxidoreductase [Streptomyces erythrochromogenes]
MQLTVLGATGPIGRQVLRQALAAGHRVTALVRDPARLPERDDARVTVVIGDAASASDVEEAARGSQALICALGPGKDYKSALATRTAGPVLEAMAAAGVTRLVWLSALGSGDTVRRQSLFQAGASRLVMGTLMADKGIADETIAGSDRDWTIALPVMFADGPATGAYETIPLDGTRGRVGGRISRADVADFLLTSATGGLWVDASCSRAERRHSPGASRVRRRNAARARNAGTANHPLRCSHSALTDTRVRSAVTAVRARARPAAMSEWATVSLSQGPAGSAAWASSAR